MIWRHHPTWKPGDPCPHCGNEQVKFNGGNPPYLACGKYVDDPPPAGVRGDQSQPS